MVTNNKAMWDKLAKQYVLRRGDGTIILGDVNESSVMRERV